MQQGELHMSERELVLVTGASSGIGRELARCFGADGSDLVLTARRESELQALAAELGERHDVKITVLPADLGMANGANLLLATMASRGLKPDVLVNCAGFGARGLFTEIPHARTTSMIALNVEALTRLTYALLPNMRARERGGVLNVASTAAFQPGPYAATYYATKSYVLSLSEALHEEYRAKGVVVSCLCPGATETEFADEAGMTDSRLFRLGMMDAVTVARVGHAGFRAGRALVVPGWRNKLGVASVRFTPRGVIRRVVAGLQR
jgi:short-subunit dehydrogenase